VLLNLIQAPLFILLTGIAIVIGMILFLRLNAFIALITAAIAVSVLSPGEASLKISRVADAFGTMAGRVGIIIALAAIIGDCLTRSGAADRVVRALLRLFGEKRAPAALMSSGFIMSVPVFFDTVFYLLLPLARSTHRRTGMPYLLLILALGAGASITHSMVPPTPGPLILAGLLKIDLGVMILMGLAVSLPTGIIMYFFVRWWSGRFDIPMRSLQPEDEALAIVRDDRLPALLPSLLPVLLPVLLIAMHTCVDSLSKAEDLRLQASQISTGEAALALHTQTTMTPLKKISRITAITGNPNLAMFLSAAIAAGVWIRHRRPKREEVSHAIELSLASAGVIILITSAGGAFGAMLKEAGLGGAIEKTFLTGESPMEGLPLMLLGFFAAFLIKFAQGSSTVAMMTAGSMMAAIIQDVPSIGLHPVYLAMAVGFGAQCGNWMNDSGFWVFAKMGGLTETETLKTWTVTVSTTALVGLVVAMIMAFLLPLV
jgi:gluconate:H+ symporter, GntP family